MGRKKKTTDALLIHRINTRINDKALKRLQSLLGKSNCHSVGELARKILSNEKVVVLQRDISFQAPVQQLGRIRSELRAIGVNINQITHHFNNAETVHQKMFHALKVGEEYAKVSEKVDVLVGMVEELGRKWLQR
ncbi:MAG TPA: plasmid mobilization relaxosome protein MobC [Cyclobacteriaceae bacterium]|nr:plasmid mobilization relaxosome protein MobC [Cyclobacteriaceae bacterium]